MIDEPQSATVVGLGVTDAELDDAVANTATEAAADLTVQTVATPAALTAILDERRVACVVFAPDSADWDPVAVIESLAARDRPVRTVLMTDGDFDAYVDAGVVGAVEGSVGLLGVTNLPVEGGVVARLLVEDGRVVVERFARVGHRTETVVVHVDPIDCVVGDVALLGNHDREGVALIADPIRREDRVIDLFERVE